MVKKLILIFILVSIAEKNASAEKLIAFEDHQTHLFGFKNEQEKIIVPAQFSKVYISDQGETLISVIKNNTFYRMDDKGELKFESVFFDNAWDYYSEGLARFIKDDKVGFHDKKGNVIISAKFDYAGPFKNGYSIVCDGCWAYYPKSPKYRPISSGRYLTIQEQYMDLEGGKWGVINNKGKIVVPMQSKSIDDAYTKISKLPLKN